MEDRLAVEVVVTNSAGKTTAKMGVYDLSRLDASLLERELSDALTRTIDKQLELLQRA